MPVRTDRARFELVNSWKTRDWSMSMEPASNTDLNALGPDERFFHHLGA